MEETFDTFEEFLAAKMIDTSNIPTSTYDVEEADEYDVDEDDHDHVPFVGTVIEFTSPRKPNNWEVGIRQVLTSPQKSHVALLACNELKARIL